MKNGTTTLCSETLPSGSGDSASFSCALTAAQLAAGTYSSVDAVFSPAATSSSSSTVSYTTSTSTPAKSFTVNRASKSTTTTLHAVTSPITRRSRDGRDLQRHGHRPERRRLPRGHGDREERHNHPVQRDAAVRERRQHDVQLLADGQPTECRHLLQRRRRLHARHELVVERRLQLHGLGVHAGAEPHGEAQHDIVEQSADPAVVARARLGCRRHLPRSRSPTMPRPQAPAR